MKRYTHSAIILLAALSLAGCSKTVEFQNNPDSALQIESVSGISPFALMLEPVSRAVITDDTLPNNESAKGIGLFVTAADGGDYDGKTEGYSNVRYTFNGEKWSTTTPVYLSKTKGKLYGYFPYSEAATNLNAIPVASSLNGTDYLYATTNDVSYTDKSVNLQMNHALARFHLTIKKGDKYLKDCELSKIAIESKAIDSYGTMDITMGTVAGSKTEGETGCVVFDGDGVTGMVTKEGIEKDILLVPADNTIGKKDISLTLTIDGVNAKINFSGDNGLYIRSGIQCNATIEIQDTGIKDIGVGVGLWGNGGSQTVQVNGHTVTVRTDEGIDKDVMAFAYEDNGDVIIKASSFQGRGLVCNVGDNAKCERSFTNGKFTFIISEICSNIEAVLGYAPLVTLNVQSDSNGKVWIGDDESKTSGQFETGQQVVILALPNDKFRLFRWNDNNVETIRTVTVGVEDITYSASFISSDLIPGLFTVNSNGKQVFFSNGNLYWDGSKYCFEDTQYTVYTKSGDELEHHIARFYWSKSADVAKSLSNYSDAGKSSSDVFFANNPKSFKVNEHTGWSVLTGGTNGEWEYLINRKNGTLCKYGVKVCSSENCLILLPDDWKWGENGVGTGWLSEYSESTIVKWSTMEAAGAVCLPAAGYRSGFDDNTRVVNDVDFGLYWSSTPNDNFNAYYLFFTGHVNPAQSQNRSFASAVRLVTEEGSPAPSVVPVESVSLDKTAATLDVNGTVTLSATVLPDNATDKSVSWSSNNTGVATVDASGKVTAVAAGTATITVTTTDGGKTATCTVTVYDLPDGALPGKFSVSATKKVYFSRGNLYADGGNALHFESNQYSFVSSEDATHVSYFTWSSTVEKAVGKSNDGDFLFCNESNKQSVDGSGKIYYALSKDEWTYLFNNHSKKWVTVNGFNGYAIAPDGFTGTIASTYADDAALAADNLVFLPAAGRSGMLINSDCYYWSSNNAGKQTAYGLSLNSINTKTDYSTFRNERLSVRLVADCK